MPSKLSSLNCSGQKNNLFFSFRKKKEKKKKGRGRGRGEEKKRGERSLSSFFFFEALLLFSFFLSFFFFLEEKLVTWLILPVVICLSQRLSHACLSISIYIAKLRMAH